MVFFFSICFQFLKYFHQISLVTMEVHQLLNVIGIKCWKYMVMLMEWYIFILFYSIGFVNHFPTIYLFLLTLLKYMNSQYSCNKSKTTLKELRNEVLCSLAKSLLQYLQSLKNPLK